MQRGDRVRTATRFIYDGTANATPRFDSVVAAGVPRGFEYEENLNAVDPDGDSLAYTFAPLAVPSVSPFPDYGPVSRVPGITLDQFGTVRIPDSFTPLLFDNVVQPSSRADYFDKFVVTDSRGAFAERDVMYDAVDRFPPTLDPIGNRTVFAGSPLTFAVTGNAPLSGLSSISLRATGLPAGATLSGGLPTISPTVTGAFTWTPVAADVGVHGVNFDVVADFGSPPQLVDSEFVEITVVSANRPPVLQEISNQRVGADPLNVQVFVSTPLTFDALAVDPNAGDTLTYSLPILIDPAGTVAPLGDLGASIVDTTDATGAPIGRVTIASDFADIGVWQLRIRVDDGAGGSDEVNVFLSVGTFTNQSPVFTTLPPAEVFIAEEGTTEFTVTASDPDNGAGGQLVTLTTTGAPPGATFPEGNVGNPVSGAFSWTPPAGAAGDYTVFFNAADNGVPSITERAETTIHVLDPVCPAPVVIHSLTPNRGAPSGGTGVTLDGQGFCGLVAVTIGGAPVSNLNVVSPLLLTFDAPPGTSGQAADVVVTAAGGSSALAGGFLYLDATPPVLTQPPDILNVPTPDGNGAVVTYALPSATDNDDPNPIVSCVPASGSLFPLGSTTVTCTATDTVGNTSSVTFIVDVVDVTPPAVVCPAPSQVVADAITGQKPIPDLLGAVLATDNVTPAGAIVLSQSPAAGALVGVGVHTVTVTATDGAGNSHTCTTTVEVIDVTAPTVTQADILGVEATSAAGAVVSFAPTVTDAVDPSPTLVCTPASGATIALGATPVTCTATDTAGNVGQATFAVQVVDTTGPTVTQADILGVEADSIAGTVVVFTPTVLDVVDPNPTLVCTPASGATFALGATPVTCTATDTAGNVGQATFAVQVVDTTGPTVTQADILGVEADSIAGTVVVFTPTVLDVVDPSPTLVCTPASGATFPLGATPVTCTATDTAGNVGQATFAVQVVDTTGPTVTQADILGVEATSAAGAVVSFAPTVTDAVDPSPTLVCTPASGATFALGTTPVTCTATDASGNGGQATFAVQVVDTVGPTVTQADILGVEADSIAGTVVVFTPTVLDAVDPNPTLACTPASGATFALGTTPVTCTATDASGNGGQATFAVQVVDTVGPTVTQADILGVEADSIAGTVVVFTPTVLDAVDPNPTLACMPASGATFALGTTPVTCTATDASGNGGQATFAVQVVDTTGPTVTQADILGVEADSIAGTVVVFTPTVLDAVDPNPTLVCTPASGATFAPGTTPVTCTAMRGAMSDRPRSRLKSSTPGPTVTQADILGVEADSIAGTVVVFTPTVLDTVDPNPTLACTPASGATFALGTTPVTCTATDASGNGWQATFAVQVVDTTGPTVTQADILGVEADSIAGTVVVFTPTVLDTVDPNPTLACTPASGATFAPGTTPVTCTATDASGNVGQATFQVEVVDTTGPTVTQADILGVEADSIAGTVVVFTPTVLDTVDPNPTLACTPASGATFAPGTTPVTCTATDASGNVGQATFQVEVVDTTGPTVTQADILGVEADSIAGTVVVFTPTVLDAVDPNPTLACTPASGATFALGTTPVTCTTTDASGNVGQASFAVQVVDTSPPSLLLPAIQQAAATSPAGAAVTLDAQATDLVDPAPTVVCVPPSGSVFPIGTTAVTCTATDASGNQDTGSFDVIVLGADDQVDDLLQDVIDGGIGPGGSMASKLEAVVDSLDSGNENSACGQLNALTNQVNAQAGKQLTQAEAAELLAAIQQIQSVLGCS